MPYFLNYLFSSRKVFHNRLNEVKYFLLTLKGRWRDVPFVPSYAILDGRAFFVSLSVPPL